MQKGCTMEREILQLLYDKDGSIRVKDIQQLRGRLKSRGFTVQHLGELVKEMRNRRLIKLTKIHDGSGHTEMTMLDRGYDQIGKKRQLAAA